jgi:hypothetical protein
VTDAVELINQTGLPAKIFRTSLADDLMLASVVAKATYRVEADGRVVRDVADPVPIAKGPLKTEFGDLPPDVAPRKEGVDVLALGRAYAPGGRPAPVAEARIAVGAWSARFAVFGNRVWKKRLAGYAITEPEPFTTMPLTWDRAFGGNAALNGKEMPHPDNPAGKGYLLDKAAVDGTPLPNVEDPDALVRAWTDSPRSFCPAPVPPGSWLTAENATQADPKTGEVTVLPNFFNCAHPRMRIPALGGGEVVEAIGMTPRAPLRFTVPAAPLHVEVSLADRVYRFAARIDTLCLLPEEGRFFVVHRCGFTYRVVPEETRLARLVPGAAPAGGAA